MDQRPSTQDDGFHTFEGPLWGVGGVASRLGIAGPTLRTWDRRYGLGPSRRTAGGHRRYTETDVARVELMSRLVDEGVPAAEAATVALSRDSAVLRSVRRPEQEQVPGPTRGTSSSVDTLVRAALVLDAATLSRVSGHVLERRGAVAGWTHVMVPALREIGERWAAGEFGVEVEHLMSERLGAELRAITRQRRIHRAVAVPVVMASAAGEQHYLPVVALEAALAERRIPCVALGPRTPAAALESAVARRDPKVVFIWRTMQQTGEEVGALNEASALRGRQLILGGPGWKAVSLTAGQGSDVCHLQDLSTAVARIEAVVRD